MNIDIVKDHLVIQKDMHGRFLSFEWIPYAKHTLEDVMERIAKWNNSFVGERTIELIADKHVREICAFVQQKYIDVPAPPDADEMSDILSDIIDDVDSVLDNLKGYMRRLKRLDSA